MYLGSMEQVIPDRGATHINVEVSVAALDTHQTILLYFRVMHLQKDV